MFLLAGTVSDGFDEHPPLLAVVPVEDVAHGLGQAALPVYVELMQGVVHSVGQAHDPFYYNSTIIFLQSNNYFFSLYPSQSIYLTRDIVLTPAPVEGGEVDACDPVIVIVIVIVIVMPVIQ